MVTLTGIAPLESHDVRLYIRLHIYISIYVYTRVFCMCENTVLCATFYVQFLSNSDNHFSCLFCVHGKFQVTNLVLISSEKYTWRRLLAVVPLNTLD